MGQLQDRPSRRVVEVATTGIDEWLQGIGGDPFGGSSSVGLRIPTLATTSRASRYLFNLASFSIPSGTKAKIVGYRQLLTLGAVVSAAGAETPGRFTELEVTSPFFRLPNGNVSWHIQRLGPPNNQGFPERAANTGDLRCFVQDYANAPALLYFDYTIPPGDAFYVDVTSYVAPNDGKPWGTPLRAGQQTTFYDLRTPWRDAHSWSSLDMDLEGPDTVSFFASVWQSPGAPAIGGSSVGLSPEEDFINRFPGSVIYWRIGGALMIEVNP